MTAICARCGREFNGIHTSFKNSPPGGNQICQRCRMAKKSGELHPAAKLTEVQVHAIREKKEAGSSLRQLAREFGIDKSTVQGITKRREWKHVA